MASSGHLPGVQRLEGAEAANPVISIPVLSAVVETLGRCTHPGQEPGDTCEGFLEEWAMSRIIRNAGP